MSNPRHQGTSRRLRPCHGGLRHDLLVLAVPVPVPVPVPVLILVLVLVLALADSRVRAQDAGALPKYPPVRLGEPSIGYQRSPTVTMVMYESPDGMLFQSALCDKHRRTVTVRSRYFVGGNRRTLVEDVDEFDVRYWPTELSVVAENTLCIGGKSEDGHTVIERWTFAAPAHEVSSPNDGSTPVHSVTTGALSHVEVLYDDAVPGRDIVNVILPVLGGKSPGLLIQFADSADLWKLDTSDQPLALVATPHPATATVANVPLVPLLSQRMRARMVREHPADGYCYFLLPSGGGFDFDDSDESNESPTIVLLRDADENGVIETFEQLTAAQFEAKGYGSSATFTSAWTY
ncbi:MAG: hypothetical protein L6Q99_15010 [Planctomycetes bacterium]|nr:hypothetical protein [Planctomycetota bacterium]